MPDEREREVGGDETDYAPTGDPAPGPEVDVDADEERSATEERPVDAVTGEERRSDLDVAFDWSPEHR